MYKYGGIYSDLDTITLKSFEPLLDQGKNGFGDLKGSVNIGIGLLLFKANSTYLKNVVQQFPKIYNPNEWATNGPILFHTVAKQFCQVNDIHYHLMPGYFQKITINATYNEIPAYLNNTHECSDLRIFPQHFFYPFLWHNQEFKNIFEKNSKDNHVLNKAVSNSYSLHYFGKLSSKFEPKPGDNSFFSSIAKKYCSFTYNYVKKNNITFYGTH